MASHNSEAKEGTVAADNLDVKDASTKGGLWRVLDDGHVGRSLVVALERFLLSFSPPFVVINGLLLMALIALIDAVTGPFAVGVFYLVPIGLVTYASGRWVGAGMAGVAAAAWSVAEITQVIATWTMPVLYWNWLSRFYVYGAIVILIAPLRDVARWEREVAQREAEATKKLRAVDELRAELEAEGDRNFSRLEAMLELRDVHR